MKTPKGTLSVPELAAYLGVGTNVAYQLVRRKDFPSLRLGERRIVVPIEPLNEWIKNNAGKPIV